MDSNTEQLSEQTTVQDTNVIVDDFKDDDVVDFDYQGDVQDELNTLSSDDYKYTKIDCLDEDPPISGQLFACMSFVSPEGVMNCNVRGLKIRGVYGSESEAQKACVKFNKMDPNFDVLVGPVGKWLPWNPTTKQIEKVNYKDKRLDKMMEKVHKSELNTLNELVGRTKDVIKNSRKSHKNRIRQGLNENIAALDKQEDEVVTEEKPKEKPARQGHNTTKTRDRLKKELEKRKEDKASLLRSEMAKVQNENASNKNKLKAEQLKKEEILEGQKEKLKDESVRITEKESNIKKLEEETAKVTDKLAQMKEYLRQKKLQKS